MQQIMCSPIHFLCEENIPKTVFCYKSCRKCSVQQCVYSITTKATLSYPLIVNEKFEKVTFVMKEKNIEISMSTIKKNIKKKRIWSSREESLLCELWATKIDMLRGARKNSHILEEISLELKAMGGILVSKEEIKTKIHNLTTKYRKEKDKVGISGGSPSSWEMYHKVHAIIGAFKMSNLKDVVEESISDNSNNQESFDNREFEVLIDDSQSTSFEEMPTTFEEISAASEELPSTSQNSVEATSGNTKSKSRDDLLKKILNKIEILEEREEKDRLESVKWEEKMYSLEVEKKITLEKISNDSEEVKNEILKFLKRVNNSK